MADKTHIEWTDATWNPTTGCNKLSQGCKNCYAQRDWQRLSKNPGTVYFGRAFEDVAAHTDRLLQPIHWKKPRNIFVNSMSDLFHESVSFDFIAAVFGVMAAASWHTFQVLTKRPERALEFFNWLSRHDYRPSFDTPDLQSKFPGAAWEPFALAQVVADLFGDQVENTKISLSDQWPLPHVQLGVSVEDQPTADRRIPQLVGLPARVRFLSMEPLLGPVKLNQQLIAPIQGTSQHGQRFIDWVICGGESGPRARPMHPDWVRSLRDQCAQAEVPFFFKQWGEWHPASCGHSGTVGTWSGDTFLTNWGDIENPDSMMVRAGKKAFGGRLLDGVEHNGFPMVQP